MTRRWSKYQLNIELLNEYTPSVAYLLGYAWADGHLSENGLTIVSKDIDHLYKLRNIAGSDAPLFMRNEKHGQLDLRCRGWVSQLQEWGFHSRKSWSGFPQVPDYNLNHFVRGLFDGDGCAMKTKNQLRVFIAGNQETTKWLLDLLHGTYFYRGDFHLRLPSKREVVIEGRFVNNNQVCHVVASQSTSVANAFMAWIYHESNGLYLDRKRRIYDDWSRSFEENLTVECSGCKSIFDRRSSTDKYCNDCRVIKRRVQNRRVDQKKRGVSLSDDLNSYRKPNELHCNLMS